MKKEEFEKRNNGLKFHEKDNVYEGACLDATHDPIKFRVCNENIVIELLNEPYLSLDKDNLLYFLSIMDKEKELYEYNNEEK